ncbi:MAG: Rrf2 family transcriptional regulator [Herpetosiphon sp.]
MHSSSRFTVAIHILTLLAQQTDEPLTSEWIAGSVNTNPVVIRRALAALRAAHFVSSQGGNGGGWRLAGNPATISLLDVYHAVEAESLFPLHHRPPNPNCAVGRHIQGALSTTFVAVAQRMEEELARTSVADVLGQVLVNGGS